MLASLLLAGSALAAAPVAAQSAGTAEAEPAPVDGTILVTGSLIARPDLKVASPVQIIGQEEIQLKQVNSAEELLRDLPSVRPSLGSAVNNLGDGSSRVDLRGLGSNRTLVLLDGRRVVPFNFDGVVDLNSIPLALIDRVDVMTGGASSAYGADAVAGVVNFITKQNFSGLDLSANYRIAERGDAAQYRADLVVGTNFADDRGNIVLGLGYQKRDALEMTKREVGAFPLSVVTGQYFGAFAAVPTILSFPTNAMLGLGASNVGSVYDPSLGAFRAGTVGDTYNFHKDTYFQTPLERYNAYAAGHYALADGIEVYASAMFSRVETRIQLAPGGLFGPALQLPLNNPYLTETARGQLCNAYGISTTSCAAAAAAPGGIGSPGYREVTILPNRRLVETGKRAQQIDTTQYQILAGIRGDVTESLKFDVSAQYGETNQDQLLDNWGSFSRVQQGLRAFRNASNVATCADAANGCVPLNLFGPEGSITSDQAAFINLDSLNRRLVSQTVVAGRLTGDLFGLASPFAGTPVSFAIGAEYRKLTSSRDTDAPSQIAGEILGVGGQITPDRGQYSAKEIFGEFNIPLIEDKPFFHSLTAEAGIRYSDYTSTGASTTWKAGGTWEPHEGFKFRGMYQVAVRSPNISELFQSRVHSLGSLAVDPCQTSRLPSAASNPGLAALCVYTGAPASTIGAIPAPPTNQISVTTSGNRDLDVERANTLTLGAVLTPRFLPRFALTIDYFRVKVKDAITQPAAGDVLNGCYSTTLNPSQTANIYCDLIDRNPVTGGLFDLSGASDGVVLTYSNLGRIETAGVDFGLSYRLPLQDLGLGGEAGTLGVSINGTWLDYYHFQANGNSINRDCTGYYSVNCANPRPEWKWVSRLTYSNGPFTGSLLWTHLSSVRLEPFRASAKQPLSAPQPGGPDPDTVFDGFEKIGAYDYFDLSLAFEASERATLTLTVDNLFDKKPPLVSNGVGGTAFNSGNTFPTVYDVLGRVYAIGARLKF